jgi:hypothetical protein
LKLYYSTNLNPRVAVAVARHLKSPVEFVRASPRDPRYEEAFRPINPNTLAPVLVEGDRSYWETDAIAWVDPSRRTGRRRRSQIPPDEIRPWTATGYQFYKRQAQDDPNVWLSLGGATGSAPGTAASN